MVISLVGPICAGKGEAARVLEREGFSFYSLSDELRAEVRLRGRETERNIMVEVGNQLRSAEPEYLARKVYEKILADGASVAVIDGIRNPAEARFLEQNLGAVLVAVEASEEVRLARFLARAREGEGKSAAEFQRVNQRDLGLGEEASGQQVAAVIAMAQARVNNDGDERALYLQLVELIRRLERPF